MTSKTGAISRVVQSIASDGLVSSCSSLAGSLASAESLPAMASLLGSAAGPPAAMISILGVSAIVEHKANKRSHKELSAHFAQIHRRLDSIDRENAEKTDTIRMLNELLELKGVAPTGDVASAGSADELAEALRAEFVPAFEGVELSFDQVQDYLRSISADLDVLKAGQSELKEGQRELGHDHDEMKGDLKEIKGLLKEGQRELGHDHDEMKGDLKEIKGLLHAINAQRPSQDQQASDPQSDELVETAIMRIARDAKRGNRTPTRGASSRSWASSPRAARTMPLPRPLPRCNTAE